MNERPKRRAIPKRIKRKVCREQAGICAGFGCIALVSADPRMNTHFDHEPALRLRNVRSDGKDYIPPQHSPHHIDARCPPCHHAKTHGTGATTAGTDTGKIKKERKRAKAIAQALGLEGMPKTKWPKRAWQKGRKMNSKAAA